MKHIVYNSPALTLLTILMLTESSIASDKDLIPDSNKTSFIKVYSDEQNQELMDNRQRMKSLEEENEKHKQRMKLLEKENEEYKESLEDNIKKIEKLKEENEEAKKNSSTELNYLFQNLFKPKNIIKDSEKGVMDKTADVITSLYKSATGQENNWYHDRDQFTDLFK